MKLNNFLPVAVTKTKKKIIKWFTFFANNFCSVDRIEPKKGNR